MAATALWQSVLFRAGEAMLMFWQILWVTTYNQIMKSVRNPSETRLLDMVMGLETIKSQARASFTSRLSGAYE